MRVAEAWKAAGRPDLAGVPLLPPIDTWSEATVPPLPTGAESSPQAQLVFAWGQPERLKIARRAAEHAEKNPLQVNLEILAAGNA